MTLNQLGCRGFATRMTQNEKLADNFSFPKHKEFFNDMYYDQEERPDDQGVYGKNTQGDQDYIDPNSPFV